MKFVTDQSSEVKLTLKMSDKEHSKGMVFLEANGQVFMGFKDGKYRLYGDAKHTAGLVCKEGFIVRDQTI